MIAVDGMTFCLCTIRRVQVRVMASVYCLSVVFVAVVLRTAYSIPIDNGVVDEPTIDCKPTSIAITFQTQNSFSGHVYVKGRYTEEGCRVTGTGAESQASLELPFETCGVSRLRTVTPKGIEVLATVVISFHPLFVTKVDRALEIKCFYMEADKTVSTEIEVSMLTTQFATVNVPMPICRYDILKETPTGDKLSFAEIGEKAYHKWTCDTSTLDTFCMTVHSCFVNDGGDISHMMINENGCSVDPVILGPLDYLTDLMAGRETHAFRFHDKTRLFFDCQITLLVKEPNNECPRPQCNEALARTNALRAAAVRSRRQARGVWKQQRNDCSTPWAPCVDVRAHVDMADVSDDTRQTESVHELLARRQSGRVVTGPRASAQLAGRRYCLSDFHLHTFLGLLCLLSMVMTVSLYLAFAARVQPTDVNDHPDVDVPMRVTSMRARSHAQKRKTITVVHVIEPPPPLAPLRPPPVSVEDVVFGDGEKEKKVVEGGKLEN